MQLEYEGRLLISWLARSGTTFSPPNARSSGVIFQEHINNSTRICFKVYEKSFPSRHSRNDENPLNCEKGHVTLA